MATRNLGIEINQGDDESFVIQVMSANGPVDITGWQFTGMIKAATDQAEPVAAFSFEVLDQVAFKGKVRCTIPNAVTTAFVTSPSDGEQKQRLTTPFVFDIKSTDLAGKKKRRAQGILFVSPQATWESPS